MHLLIILVHPDSQLLLSTSKQMEDALGGYATLYAYDNLSSDPDPGNMHLIIKLTFVSALCCLAACQGTGYGRTLRKSLKVMSLKTEWPLQFSANQPDTPLSRGWYSF